MCGMGRQTKFAVVASAVVASVLALGAPTASADDQDDYFVQQLEHTQGIRVPNDSARAQAIEAAKLACNLKAQGLSDVLAFQGIKAKYPKVDPDIVYRTFSMGLSVYCPQYLNR
jgi:hypothetical protein